MKNSNYNFFNNNGFAVLKLSDDNPLLLAQALIKKENLEKIKSDKIFYEKVLNTQRKLIKYKIHLKFLFNEIKQIKSILKVKNPYTELSVTPFFHLRAVRKSQTKKKNFIGFHRETFYSDQNYTKYQLNISIPILNYSNINSMRVIPKSHKIPDSRIFVKKIKSKLSTVKKFSTRHKLGMPYSPKIIVSGVNLKKSQRLNMKDGQFCIFNCCLIHGNGSNPKKEIRYSIDFAIIKNKFLKNEKIKKQFHSPDKNKLYFRKIKDITNE